MGTLVNGIKEIFATAKTTGSNVMLCANDGTPDGHMTMANLASVLGGATLQITTQNYDLNNAPYGRIGSSSGDVSQTLANAPEQGKRANFVCTTYKCDDTGQYKVQEFVYTSASSTNPTKYMRKGHHNKSITSYDWGPWYQVYDTSLLTNSTLLTPLASALGGIYPISFTQITGISDLNKLPDKRWTYVNARNTIENMPPNMPQGLDVLVFCLTFGLNKFQLATRSNYLATRSYINDWSTWKVI